MIINSYEKLTEWLTEKFLKLTDAEPAALAKYTLALIKCDVTAEKLKSDLVEKLHLFLSDDTEFFVDELMLTLETKSYMNETTKKDTSDDADNINSDEHPVIQNHDQTLTVDDNCKKIKDQHVGTHGNDSPMLSNRRRRRRRSSDDSDGRSWDHRRASRSPSRLSRHDRNAGYNNRSNYSEKYVRDYRSNNSYRRNDIQRQRRNERHLTYSNTFENQRSQLTVESFVNSLQSISRPTESDTDSSTNQLANPGVNILSNLLTTLASAAKISTSINPINTFNRQNYRNRRYQKNEKTSKYDSTMKTLCVCKIPQDHYSEHEIVEYFSKFGAINHITMHHNNEPNSCVIEFNEHNGAKAAYTSPDAVFGNRFVKLFWLKPSTNIIPSNATHSAISSNANVSESQSEIHEGETQLESTASQNSNNQQKKIQTNPKPAPKKVTIKKEDATFLSEEYLQAKEKQIQEKIEKQNKMKEIEKKIIEMCTEEQTNILAQLKNPDLTTEQKDNLTNMLKKVIEKKDSIIYKKKYDSSKIPLSMKKKLPTVNKVSKAKKFQPVRRKIDRRTTQIIIYLKPTTINSNEIINAYKKFGKVISTTIVEGKHIIITYVNHKSVIDSTSYGVFLPNAVESVKMYQPQPSMIDHMHTTTAKDETKNLLSSTADTNEEYNTTTISQEIINTQTTNDTGNDSINLSQHKIEVIASSLSKGQRTCDPSSDKPITEVDQEGIIEFLKDYDE